MVYGNTKCLDEGITKDFETLGISHITSVSGSNLAMFISIIGLIFQKTDRYKLLKYIIELLAVIFFNMICSGEYSIVRASICFVISKLFILFGKKTHPIKILIISLYILLLINPYSIFNLGLQLSYLATLGIILFSKKITHSIIRVFKKIEKKKRIYKLICIISDCISITISAQILILPIQIINFHSISLMLLPANVLVFFITTPILFLGLMGVIFAFIPSISILLFKIISPFIYVFMYIVKSLASITPKLSIAAPPYIIVLLYYFLIIAIIYIDKYVIEIIKIKEKYIKKSNILKVIIITVFIILIIFSYIYITYFDEYIYFFNVGQGNACFLRYNGTNIVLDAGSLQDNLSFNVLDNFFKSKGIETIDLIIISHFHKDHVNAVYDLIKNYNIKEIVYSLPIENSGLYEEIMELSKDKKIQQKIVGKGDIFTTNNIKFKILLPSKKNVIQDNDIANANSMVLQIEIKDKKYLFMGDATKSSEEHILKNNELEDVYLLSVGHHGSKTSTCEEFIQEINPSLAIISSKKSVYGHPSQIVLEILKKYKIKVLITEKLGAIKIKL